jgi:aldose sugar dehydrogenase
MAKVQVMQWSKKIWVLCTQCFISLVVLLMMGMVACGGGGSVDIPAADAESSSNPMGITPSIAVATLAVATATTTPAVVTVTTPTGTTPATSSPATPVPLKVAELSTSLSNPWSLAFLPDGRMLVTERAGRLRLVGPQGAVLGAISGVPAVDSAGQGGLMDVVLDPAFASNQRIYFSFSESDTANASLNSTAVARARLDAAGLRLTELQVIYRQTPKVASTGHYGSRLVFDRNGYLFVTLGDRQIDSQRGFAQDLTRGNGKVVRITTDGAPAPGNPRFAGTPGAQAAIWSYGHRNPQGAALHPVTGQLWVNEHGAQGGDELNLSLAGYNYGWPLASYSQEYGTTTPVGPNSLPGMTAPVSYWITRDGRAYTGGAQSSIAPSGMAIYAGDKFPQYQGNVFIGALAGTALWRVVLGGADGRTEVSRERLLASRGERIRDVRVGLDGWLYLLTDGAPGKLLRVTQ